jgi:regulatory protein YycH of two-component signal transduction system YycFG
MKLEERSIIKPKVVHLLNAYFNDPSFLQTRSIASGVKWYTDGFHSVVERQSPYGEQITYQSPSGYVSHLPVNEADAINTAVNFVNDHGGFTGQVSLQIISSFQQAAPITVALQQVIDGWTVFGSFSRQVVTIQNNAVISMQTPLSYMGSIIDEQTVTILSGTSFLHHLTNKQLNQVTSIAIGYGTKLTNFGTLQLIPVYQVKYESNHVVYYDARTGEIFNEAGMA